MLITLPCVSSTMPSCLVVWVTAVRLSPLVKSFCADGTVLVVCAVASGLLAAGDFIKLVMWLISQMAKAAHNKASIITDRIILCASILDRLLCFLVASLLFLGFVIILFIFFTNPLLVMLYFYLIRSIRIIQGGGFSYITNIGI